MIEFNWPWALALLPLPLFIYFLVPPAKYKAAALRVPFFEQLKTMSETNAHTFKKVHGHKPVYLMLLALFWVTLIVATCRPLWVGEPIELPTSGRDIMLAIDISGSMETKDLKLDNNYVPRLTVVKSVLSSFIERRRGDRIGLLLFGTQAYLQSPLTFDRNAVNILLNEAQIGFAGKSTAIGNAIGLAVKRLRNRPENSRVLILLTDGANTAGEVTPIDAATMAQKNGVRIHTIGVGATQMLIPSLFGTRKTNPSADLDEALLQEIAAQTGGQYFRAYNSDELEHIYTILDKIEPIMQEAETLRPTKALYFWPLGVALILAIIIGALRFNLYLTRPQYNSGDE